MKCTGYVRVSTVKQTNEHWKLLLTEYAESKGLPAPVWVEDTASGSKPWRKRNLAGVMAMAEPGDLLIVGEASRIGRDAEDALNFIKSAKAAGVIVHVVQAGQIITPDDESINAELIIGILFQIAQYERRLLSYRIKLGLKKAKESGTILGGYRGKAGRDPGGAPVRADKKQIIKAVRKGKAIHAASREYGVSRTTLYRWLAE